MFEQILAYQNLDSKIIKLKRELEKDPAKQNINNAMAIAKDFQNKLVELDSFASKTLADFEKNKKEINFSNWYKLSFFIWRIVLSITLEEYFSKPKTKIELKICSINDLHWTYPNVSIAYWIT